MTIYRTGAQPMNLKDFATKYLPGQPKPRWVDASPMALIIRFADPLDEREEPAKEVRFALSMFVKDGARLGDADLVELNGPRVIDQLIDEDDATIAAINKIADHYLAVYGIRDHG